MPPKKVVKKTTAKKAVKKAVNKPKQDIRMGVNNARLYDLLQENNMDDLYADMLRNDTDCEYMREIARHGKVLGKGSYGEVYAGKVNNHPYAFKLSTDFNIDANQLCALLPQMKLKDMRLTAEQRRQIMRYNNITEDTLVDVCRLVNVIPKNGGCITQEQQDIPLSDGSGDVIEIPAGSYLCTDMYVEYLIMLLLSRLKKGGMNTFFIPVYNFNTCTTLRTQMYAMEIAHSRMMDLLTSSGIKYYKLTVSDATSIMVQLLFAMAVMQENYLICHNDMHVGNIFLSELSDAGVVTRPNYKGDRRPSKWNAYVIRRGGKIVGTYYVPASKYIVRLGDFGMAVKYSEPIIGNADIVRNQIVMEPTGEAYFPNWYAPIYDLLYSMSSIVSTTSWVDGAIEIMQRKIKGASKYSPEHLDALAHINRIARKIMADVLDTQDIYEYIDDRTKRPHVDDLRNVKSKCKTALELLLNGSVLNDAKFAVRKRPIKGYIKVIAVLDI